MNRQALCQLVRDAIDSRPEEKEKQALTEALRQIETGESLDSVVTRLPHLRYARGLIAALGWAAEAEDTKDEAWRREAQEECHKAEAFYRRVVN